MSQYAKDLPAILATLQENDNTAANTNTEEEKGKIEEIHVYPVEGGGILLTKTPIDQDAPQETIVDSQERDTQTPPPPKREPPFYLHFFLILCFFLFLDSADTTLTALLSPTATITIMPNVRSITVQSTAQLGERISPITLSESQTIPTTGHGHQIAQAATGTLTFYNGLFTAQFVSQGTVFTGNDGVHIVATQPANIPAGNPNVGYGTATVTAQAIKPGAAGNITPGDINITINNGLLVKNSQFSNGQDERDYMIVTQQDRDTAAAQLKAKVTASMHAALQEQIPPTQQLQTLPCTPAITADHVLGAEATQVTVTVSETCSAIAYNAQELNAQATKLLTTQATKTVGTGYMLYGNAHVSVTQATTQKTAVLLSFTCQGTYMYQLNEAWQKRLKTLIAGEPRLTALHQLVTLPGIMHASISGIPDNQPIPIDATHIHLFIVLTVF